MDVVHSYDNHQDTIQQVADNKANDQVNYTGKKGYLKHNNKNIFLIFYFIQFAIMISRVQRMMTISLHFLNIIIVYNKN